MNSVTSIQIDILGCKQCPLHQTCKLPVPGHGDRGASDVMFVGEAPGAEEDQDGTPFRGPSGQLLRDLAEEANIGPAYYTNVIKCRPPDNRDPKQSEIDACLHYLDAEIEAINPKVIVAVGRYAMVQFMPDDFITKVHGKPHIVHGRIVIPIIHTAAALRRAEYVPAIRADLRLVPRLLDTPIESSPGAKLTIL